MADNVAITAGAGTSIKTDQIGSDHYQQVKLADGTLDSATVIAAGNGTSASALRVTISSDSTGVLSVDDNGASLTVDNAALSVTGGGVEASALRVTIASDSTGVLSVDDGGGSLTIDGAHIATEGSALGSGVLIQGDDGTDRHNLQTDSSGNLKTAVQSSGQTWGTDTAFTITLNSLADAASATSSAVDLGNPGPFALSLECKLDGLASGTGLVDIYAQWSNDNTDFTDSGNDFSAVMGVVQMNETTAVIKVFSMPVHARYVKIRAQNNSGAALAASGNTIRYVAVN